MNNEFLEFSEPLDGGLEGIKSDFQFLGFAACLFQGRADLCGDHVLVLWLIGRTGDLLIIKGKIELE